MTDEQRPGGVSLKLSTGYVVSVNLERLTTGAWRTHLARAILGERLFAEAKQPSDRAEPGVYFDVVPEEINYLIATTDASIKDALLYQIFYEEVMKLARKLDKKFSSPVANAAATAQDSGPG